MTTAKSKDFSRAFGAVLGEIKDNGAGTQPSAHCPFCDSTNKLYFSASTGQWDCKKCGEEGNLHTLLTALVDDVLLPQTTERQLQQLADERGLRVETLQTLQICWNPFVDCWVVPTFNERGNVAHIINLMPKSGGGYYPMNLPTLSSKVLLNGNALAQTYSTVYVVEGIFDVLSMQELIDDEETDAIVVGVLGANAKTAIRDAKERLHDIVTCFDNDEAGAKATEKFPLQHRTLNWPEVADALDKRRLPDGYDINDALRDGATLGLLDECVSERKDDGDGKEPDATPKDAKSTGITRDDIPAKYLDRSRSFKDVISDLERLGVILTPTQQWNFAVACAAIIATRIANIAGCPPWIIFVSAPSAGKSFVLSLFRNLPDFVFEQSATSATALVSGYEDDDKPDEDPSVLGKVNGITMSMKDMTELLVNIKDGESVFAVLRGAFDGGVQRHYGNGKIVNLRTNFGFIGAVTHKINEMDSAALGDRFLRMHTAFEMTDAHAASIAKRLSKPRKVTDDKDHSTEIAHVVGGFLYATIDEYNDRDSFGMFDAEVTIALEQCCRKIALSRWRAGYGIDRDRNSITHATLPESVSRVYQQILLLMMLLTACMRLNKPSLEIFNVMRSIVDDTAASTRLQIIEVLRRQRAPIDRAKIATLMRLRSEAIESLVDAWVELGVVKLNRQRLMRQEYSLSDEIRQMLDLCDADCAVAEQVLKSDKRTPTPWKAKSMQRGLRPFKETLPTPSRSSKKKSRKRK